MDSSILGYLYCILSVVSVFWHSIEFHGNTSIAYGVNSGYTPNSIAESRYNFFSCTAFLFINFCSPLFRNISNIFYNVHKKTFYTFSTVLKITSYFIAATIAQINLQCFRKADKFHKNEMGTFSLEPADFLFEFKFLFGGTEIYRVDQKRDIISLIFFKGCLSFLNQN